MMEELMVKWLREVWHSRLGALLKKRRMLVLNVLKGHLAEKVRTVAYNLLNTYLAIIPGGMTSQLQALDMEVNKPFKDQPHHLAAILELCTNSGRLSSGLRLLGITFHQIRLSRGVKGAECQTGMKSKMMSFGRKMVKKTLLMMMKMLTVTDHLT
jgi:hypothetical protein